MHVGFVVDETRVRLVGTDEYPELEPGDDDRCSVADRPGLLGHFESAGRRFELLVVHFAAMPNQAEKRRTQWGRVLRIAGERHGAGVPVAIIGDVNSTGFRDDVAGERTFIREKVAAAGMRLLSDGLACSEYFTPDGQQHLEPSALDHIAVTPDFPVVGTATVQGYCVETRCHPIYGARPADFVAVSDHCPVVVGGQ